MPNRRSLAVVWLGAITYSMPAFSAEAASSAPKAKPARLQVRASVGVAVSRFKHDESLSVRGANTQVEAGYSADYAGVGPVAELGFGVTWWHVFIGLSYYYDSTPLRDLSSSVEPAGLSRNESGKMSRSLFLFTTEFRMFRERFFAGPHLGLARSTYALFCCSAQKLPEVQYEFRRKPGGGSAIVEPVFGARFGYLRPWTENATLRIAGHFFIMPLSAIEGHATLGSSASLTLGLVLD